MTSQKRDILWSEWVGLSYGRIYLMDKSTLGKSPTKAEVVAHCTRFRDDISTGCPCLDRGEIPKCVSMFTYTFVAGQVTSALRPG
jgi:hypothetical protein